MKPLRWQQVSRPLETEFQHSGTLGQKEIFKRKDRKDREEDAKWRSEIGDVKTPEAMAVNLLGLFEAERIKIPPEATLRSSLQLPERSGTTRGMIYTPRTGGGDADDFWSLALAAWSARSYETPFAWHAFTPRSHPQHNPVVFEP